MFSLFSTLYGLNFYNDCDRVIVGRLMLRITTSKTQNNEEAVLFAIRVHAIVSWLGKQRRLACLTGSHLRFTHKRAPRRWVGWTRLLSLYFLLYLLCTYPMRTTLKRR